MRGRRNDRESASGTRKSRFPPAIIITLSCSRPSGRVFSFLPSFPVFPSRLPYPSFFHHRRGSLISFLFVRVAFNKLSLTSSLVQQPLCLAPVNSPAFDNRPRRAYASFTATLFLLSSCPLILLLLLLFHLLHPFTFTRRVPFESNLHLFFFLKSSFRDVCPLPARSLVSCWEEKRIKRRSAGTSVVRSGRIPKTRNEVHERE